VVVDRFSIETMARGYEQVYRDAIKRSRAAERKASESSYLQEA
jgi:hypothetical protein